MTKIYIIAGEASGDFIGSCLMQNLKLKLNSAAKFVGIGGSLMSEQGLNSLFSIDEISLMGFFEILPHIFRIKSLIEQTALDVLTQKPDILITIDAPGFTYRVAKRVRELRQDLKMVHIVAPSVWAYKPGRALKYAKVYDHLLALLPFEPPYFEKVGLKCSYIGHPVLEQKFYHDKKQLPSELKLTDRSKILCITPGSRLGEIKRHMIIFAKAIEIIAKKYKELEVIFVLASPKYENLIKSYLKDCKLNIKFTTDRLQAFAIADVALAKSGTNSLEIAASGTPMIVAYRTNTLSFLLLKLLIKIKYASLINIIANKPIIPEFIQSNCKPKKIAYAIMELLSSSKKSLNQVKQSEKVLKYLGLNSIKKPSLRAAEIILEIVSS